MTVLYILGGIVGGVLLLALLLGCVKISVTAGYAPGGDRLLKIKIACFTFDFSSEKEPKRKRKGQKKQKKPDEEIPAKKKKKKKKKQPKPYAGSEVTLSDLVGAFRDLVTGLLALLAKHLKIEKLRLQILVATDDAAKTALEYGAVCALVQSLQLAVLSAPRVNEKQLCFRVECDFLAEKPEIEALVCVSTRVWRMALVGLHSIAPIKHATELVRGYNQQKEEKKSRKDG